MADPIFDTSCAKTVKVPIRDFDSLLPALVYSDITALPGTPIDLTTFYFKFELKRIGSIIATYEILSGEMANAFLSKGGADNDALNMQGMFEDIRSKMIPGKSYVLIQKVTDDQGLSFVHIIYQLNATTY